MELSTHDLRPGSGSESFRNLPGPGPGRHAQDGFRPVVFKTEHVKE